ncbi:MAG: hypothetical protein KH284_11215 [Clostridiales bacterium]|nr:hypothetical protein [Clostridiales bacterium]
MDDRTAAVFGAGRCFYFVRQSKRFKKTVSIRLGFHRPDGSKAGTDRAGVAAEQIKMPGQAAEKPNSGA